MTADTRRPADDARQAWKRRRQQRYLGGVITVEPACLEYAAFVTGNPALWALGSNPREAIGYLVMSHPEAIIEALAAAQAPDPERERREP